jgi:hypothetical protein
MYRTLVKYDAKLIPTLESLGKVWISNLTILLELKIL